jgi:hypothetical protein
MTSKLLAYVQNHPALVAATGAGGGLGAWIVTHADTLVLLFQLVGGFFGCLLAVVSFLFVLPKLIRFCRRGWRDGFVKADQDGTRPPRR